MINTMPTGETSLAVVSKLAYFRLLPRLQSICFFKKTYHKPEIIPLYIKPISSNCNKKTVRVVS